MRYDCLSSKHREHRKHRKHREHREINAYSFKNIAVAVGTCIFMLVIVLLIIILPILFPPIYAGVVTHKGYEPSHTYMVPVRAGKIMTYQRRTRSEKYTITIVKDDKESTHTVDRALYERVKIGDYIDLKGK